MKNPKVLFISGSLGLGHVTRDLAIARELRKKFPTMEIKWLAAHPASLMLENAGEKILPEAKEYANENEPAEISSKGTSLNLLTYLMKAKGAWQQNVNIFAKIVNSQHFDLVIGDETYEIVLALRKQPEIKKFVFVMIYDFVGLSSMSANPLEQLGTYMWNLKWTYDYRKKISPPYDLGLFVGELNDVPDKSFGFMMPNRKKYARATYKFIGYILPFDPTELPGKKTLRKKHGYNNEPLIIASIGGTSIGKELLELCGKAFTIARERIQDLHMVLISGPRIKADIINVPDEVEVLPFVPNLYEHFAACDLAIIQGGATSAVELTALKKPFIYFPLEKHFEQANVARILNERKAGVEMKYSNTTPESLAEKIVEMTGVEVSFPKLPVNGAKKAAELIAALLKS
jgi:UDP:flavonoid glycosyltransferase YjiC (YdhE family)